MNPKVFLRVNKPHNITVHGGSRGFPNEVFILAGIVPVLC